MSTLAWEPLDAGDLDAVLEIAAIAHPGLPERRAVLAEKQRLFPPGARKAMLDGAMLGYALAHPWMLGRIPKLDTALGALPAVPDCLYIHDVALLPAARGRNGGGLIVQHYAGRAAAEGLGRCACVSVYGTAVLWQRHGFRIVEDAGSAPQLESYGAGACYMVLEI